MGLRGFVDAWGVPVIREGFTRPALTEPANKPANKPANSPPPANKPNPDASSRASAGPGAEPVQATASGAKPATDRAVYMRELMRAKRAKAKAKDKA